MKARKVDGGVGNDANGKGCQKDGLADFGGGVNRAGSAGRGEVGFGGEI
jgi:hypothetical protein